MPRGRRLSVLRGWWQRGDRVRRQEAHPPLPTCSVGASLVEEDKLDLARELEAKAKVRRLGPQDGRWGVGGDPALPPLVLACSARSDTPKRS